MSKENVSQKPRQDEPVTPQPPREPELRPRAQRRPRDQAKAPRGLPHLHVVRDLAAVCLAEQRRHWPELVKRRLLPDPADPGALTSMVETFCGRHATGKLPDLDPSLLKHVPQLAACYSRYSCDNSSPTSVADQVVNELRKARAENRSSRGATASPTTPSAASIATAPTT
jgi:hypothetical protein